MCGSAREHPAALHDVCVEAQENIQQRCMTYVWKCKSTFYGAEVEQDVITPPHTTPPPQKYQDAKISTRAWPLTGVDTKSSWLLKTPDF